MGRANAQVPCPLLSKAVQDAAMKHLCGFPPQHPNEARPFSAEGAKRLGDSLLPAQLLVGPGLPFLGRQHRVQKQHPLSHPIPQVGRTLDGATYIGRPFLEDVSQRGRPWQTRIRHTECNTMGLAWTMVGILAQHDHIHFLGPRPLQDLPDLMQRWAKNPVFMGLNDLFDHRRSISSIRGQVHTPFWPKGMPCSWHLRTVFLTFGGGHSHVLWKKYDDIPAVSFQRDNLGGIFALSHLISTMTEALPIDEAIAKRMQSKKGKELYGYQKNAIDTIMSRIRKFPEGYNLLYQLPTGGGKTVIFSELAKRFILETGKRVLILTHRIELLGQTSSMLTEIGVPNKIINSKVKELEDSDDHWCFVAMVETLNNRLNDEQIEFADLGLVVVDEAHYNSFRKLFKHFDSQILLGVTATPLSSNIKLPLHDNYSELIVGESIGNLVGQGFLAKAGTYSYDVNLRALKVGINGDYTVSSSERLYGNFLMQEKLLYAYEEKAKGTKTLIFNNGINTSKQVQAMFEEEGYACMHLDNTHSEKERADILHWFHTTPDAVLSSVSILTTGFDEPSVETIILNRATKSLTLYHQMIGRGSRILKHKSAFTVIDLGNNARRFGLWDAHINWHDIFKSPQSYIDGLYTDEEIEEEFVYEMPEELAERFKGGPEMTFDMAETYAEVTRMALRPKEAIHRSMSQHVAMIQHASDDYWDAVAIVDLLGDDIKFRVKQYAKCIAKATANYRSWLEEEYTRNLKTSLRHAFNDEE